VLSFVPALPDENPVSMKEAVRVQGLDGFEGVAADELSEGLGLVCRSHPDGAHLVQGDAYTALGERPGGLASS